MSTVPCCVLRSASSITPPVVLTTTRNKSVSMVILSPVGAATDAGAVAATVPAAGAGTGEAGGVALVVGAGIAVAGTAAVCAAGGCGLVKVCHSFHRNTADIPKITINTIRWISICLAFLGLKPLPNI